MTAVRRLLIFVCVFAAVALVAQTAPPAAPQTTITTTTADVPRETAPVTADTDKDYNDPRALRLSMKDAIDTSVKQNLGVELQQFEYGKSGQLLIESHGIFDWLGTGNLAHSSQRQPVSSQVQSSATTQTVADVGVSQEIPTGGLYSIGFNNSWNRSNNRFATVNPAIDSSLQFQFTQPLLRNFGVDVTERGITIARNNLGISREAFRGQLMDTVSSTEQAYLDLVYARRFVDVAKEAVFLARDQARITQIRINVGASAPLDILQPRVQIATTESELINAVAAVRDAEDRIRALLNLPPADWGRPIIPTDDVTYKPLTIDTEQALTRAFDLRPELKETQLTTANRRVQYMYAKNQVLPRVDLVASYQTAGLAGTETVVDQTSGQPIGTITNGWTHAVNQVLGRDFPSWTVGVNLGMPILNIAAKAEAKRSQLDWEESRVNEDQVRQTIATGVRATARAIDTAARQITATRTAREAAEENVSAERKRYENGMATNFEVLQIQQQLSTARANELQALVGYNKAVAAFHRQVGDILDVQGIVTDVPAVNEPHIFSNWDRYNFLNYASHTHLESGQ